MSNSVYSIILSDEVVAAVDKLSFIEHTSRSNMINRILAQYVGLTTREVRADDVFSVLEQFITASENLVHLPRTGGNFAVRSAIEYKYNPTVKYIVELCEGEVLCKLRVSLRTQNEVLISYLNDFYNLWCALENYNGINRELLLADGKYECVLMRPKILLSAEKEGEVIGAYIMLFDNALKAYFGALPNQRNAALAAKQIYNDIPKELLEV